MAASLLLIGVCSPVLEGVRGYALGSSATDTAAGVAQVFDSLRPGMVARLSFRAPSSDGQIVLSGNTVTVLWEGHAATRTTSWLLPNETLAAGQDYGLRLAGARLEVFPLVRD